MWRCWTCRCLTAPHRRTTSARVSPPATRFFFSLGDNPDAIREALTAGASGISRKAEDIRDTLEMVRMVAAGQTIDNQELAAAISSDRGFVAAELSKCEHETLKFYATGFTRGQIATRMNISANTVGTNIKRIREKYAAAGRYAPTPKFRRQSSPAPNHDSPSSPTRSS